MERLVSLVGLFTMVGIAWLMSSHKRKVNLRIVGGGMLLQFGLALLVLRTESGHNFFKGVGDFVTQLLNYVDVGSAFVFGDNFGDHFFAFKVLPTIIFFSALMSIFYYMGIMQRLVAFFAFIMRTTLRTSGAETLSASANIFVGQTEAPLVIGPYVGRMTMSELMAVMVGGFATVAGGVLAVYIGFGIDAAHLITASVISAPAALLIAKVMEPETDVPKTFGRVEMGAQTGATNLVDAAAVGASNGMRLAINVAAMIIAFLALIAALDALIGWLGIAIGDSSNYLFGTSLALEWSLGALLGYLFAPLAWIMGIEWGDCFKAGELLGIRLVANELIAYQQLGEMLKEGAESPLSPRTEVILTYALCGFANFSSIGIQIGGISSIAPERRGDLAKLGLRAMIGGALACSMTACVAGILITGPPAQEEKEAEETLTRGSTESFNTSSPLFGWSGPSAQHGGSRPANTAPRFLPAHLALRQLEPARQQFAELHFSSAIIAIDIDKQHRQLVAKLGHELTARTTRRGSSGRRDGDRLEPSCTLGHRMRHRHALGTDRQTINGVLDIGAGEYTSVDGAQCGAYEKTGILGIRPLPRVARGSDQFSSLRLVHHHVRRKGSWPPFHAAARSA